MSQLSRSIQGAASKLAPAALSSVTLSRAGSTLSASETEQGASPSSSSTSSSTSSSISASLVSTHPLSAVLDADRVRATTQFQGRHTAAVSGFGTESAAEKYASFFLILFLILSLILFFISLLY